MNCRFCPCLILLFAGLLILCSVPVHPVMAATPAPEIACPSCEDYNACTIDSCETGTGTCRHDPIDCNDGNSCTTDSCTAGPTSVCRHVGLAPGSACNDGNSCSTGDACNAFQQCAGTLLPSGASCNDGNGCTASDICNDAGICLGDPLHSGDSCDDGSLCTSGETCVSEGGALVCRGSSPACDDGNPCTQDRCDESTGLCIHPPVSCDDGNSCTGDTCDVATGVCVRTFLSDPCTDHNVCTGPDVCSGGNCLGGGPPGFFCFDNNQCTNDSCDPVLGCIHTPSGICDDHNACTFDDCFAGMTCSHPPKSCDDHIACTLDSCDPSSGCTHLANCDDGDPCTTDICDATQGCMHSPVPITLDLNVDLLPMTLAPANHKLVPVTATVTAPGFCGGALTIRLESITSSQPDDADGPTDGHTIGDIQGAELGTADFSFLLRAETDRAAFPRFYTVTYSATGGGLSDTASQTVIVLDHGKRSPKQVTEPKQHPAPKE